MNAVFVDEPNIDLSRFYRVAGKRLRWRDYVTEDPDGKVDLAALFGPLEGVAVYAYAVLNLPESRDLILKIGSNDGFKCWFNQEEVGRFDGGRGYAPDQDSLPVRSKRGANRILLKITQMGAGWAFSARLTDTQDEPIDLTQTSR